MHKAKIIVLGTFHPLQCGTGEYTQKQIDNYRRYIKDLCHSYDIKHIAEEISHDGLVKQKANTTIASAIASNLRIEYNDVDLTIEERENLKIDDNSLLSSSFALCLPELQATKHIRTLLTEKISHPVRECCWLSRIINYNIWPTLLICGVDHVENIRKLINSIEQEVVVACHDYNGKSTDY